jgi:spore maturation protein CgeB
MRILILNSDSLHFLRSFYAATPELRDASFATQTAARASSLVGMCDFYSRNFRALGHEAQEIYVNNPYAQGNWAREHGLNIAPLLSLDDSASRSRKTAGLRRALQPVRGWLAPMARRMGLIQKLEDTAREVLRAQIESYNPDVILVQNIVLVDSELLRAVRKPGRVIVAQHGVAPPEGVDYGVYDFGVSMLPYVLDHFRAAGLPGEQVHLAFEPGILDHLPAAPQKDLPLTFVGGIEAQYDDRVRMLEAIARRFPIEIYLSGSAGLPASSPIEQRRRKEVWGLDMYRVLQRSRVTLNSHIDAARQYAGNMRLFEATGTGTCLLTDAKSNLPTLFEPGAEVATYTSIDDCLAQIDRLLNDDAKRDEIAARGHRRTLAAHTYRQRAEQLLGYIGRYGA